MFGVGELIWSAVAVVASIGMTVVVVYFMFVGRNDRAREEEAREFFDRHGHWPDEDPT
jgi:hypothetical protein